MTIGSDDDLTGLKEIGRIVRECLMEMARQVRAGVATAELDEIGGRFLAARGARSAPRLAYNFPGHTCISVNDEAAHGIPGTRVLRNGDLVNVDVSAELNGYWADTGSSFPVGPVAAKVERLCGFTKTALRKAIYSARASRPINAIGRAVEREATRGGYNVIPDLAGHGVGRGIHEPPTVANVYVAGNRKRLNEGLVITIEPFLTEGAGTIVQADDGWTLKTADGALSAQYEHTLVITKGHPIVVT